MKETTLIALGTLLAVVLSTQVSSHAFYVGLVSFERNTNCVVRQVLEKLTGQPAAALRPPTGRLHLPPSIEYRPLPLPPDSSRFREHGTASATAAH